MTTTSQSSGLRPAQTNNRSSSSSGLQPARDCIGSIIALWVFVLGGALMADPPETVTIRGVEHRIWPVENLRQRGFDIPDVPKHENAADSYLEAINAYVDLPESLDGVFEYAATKSWPKNQTTLEEYIDQPGNRKAIDAARRASTMPHCLLPYFGDPRDSVIGVILPNLSNMRMLGKLLVAEGKRLESRKQHAEAVATYQAAMRVGAHVGEGYTLIEGLVGIAIFRLGEMALTDLAMRIDLSPSTLKDVRRELDSLASRVPTADRGLRGERSFGPAVVDEVCSRPLSFLRTFRGIQSVTGNGGDAHSDANFTNPVPTDGWGKLELRIGRLLFPDRVIKSNMAGFYELFVSGKVTPRVVRADSGTTQDAEERYLRENIPKWDILSRTLLPSLSRATSLGARSRADFALTRVAVALRLHMAENEGQWPKDLTPVVESLPKDALDDPFGEGSLKFRATRNGWLVYSLGHNGVDDGGLKGNRPDDLDMVIEFPPPPVVPFEADEKAN